MTIRPALAADIAPMIDLLHTHMNSKFSKQRWRRLFTYTWCAEKPDFGRVAEVGGEIVGCVAAIYSDRLIDGQLERFVNPAAWYLKKEARGTGLGIDLMADLTSNPEWHYHVNTSSKNTTGLLERIGFGVLDDAKYVWRRGVRSAGMANLVTELAAIHAAISEDESRILRDHHGLPVTPVFCMATGSSALLILGNTIKNENERWLDVMYVSNPKFLAENGDAVAQSLLREPDMVFAADARFCKGEAEGAKRVTLDVARYAKSQTLSGHYIDHLYSEIQLMGQKLR